MNKVIICFIAIVFFNISCFSQVTAKAENGILDLRSRNWNKDGITDINGEWEFYWQKLYTPQQLAGYSAIDSPGYINVPGFWSDVMPASYLKKSSGFATYRIKILCPSSDKQLFLKLLTISTAYKLFINGKEVLRVGQVGTNASTSVPAFMPAVVPAETVNNELEIVIQVSNFDYRTGGIWDFIKLGTNSDISNYRMLHISKDFFVVGSFFILGVFHLIIFFFFRKKYPPLYLGILCILVSVRIVSTGEITLNIFSNINWYILIRLEYLSMFLILPFALLFIRHLFPKDFSRIVLKYFLWASLPFVLITLFTPPSVFTYTLRPFELLMLLASCYGVFIGIKTLKNKRTGSLFSFIGFIVLLVNVINDILYTSLLIETEYLFYVGIFIFILFQAVSVSKQFSRTLYKLGLANNKLSQINEELTVKNNAINEKNQQLLKLNNEMDGFVSRVSHDLRSPIASVMSLIDVAASENDPAVLHSYLEMEKTTLNRLDAVVNDIIDFSRNNRVELNFEPVNFKELINNVLEDHRYLANSPLIKKRIEVLQPCNFISDVRRLNIIFNNLVSNGIKYFNKNAAQPYLHLKVNVNTTIAEIQVADNGQGIAEAHLNKIFNMFYRAANDKNGTGLGLYVAKEAVEKLGGTIKVESQLNKGTIFTIVIPNHRHIEEL